MTLKIALSTAKRAAAIQRLRTRFTSDFSSVTLSQAESAQEVTFHLHNQQQELEAWLSDYFQQPVTLASNLSTGFPDDTEAAGPTVISTATLEAVASWYPGISVEEVRRRFRTNLELGGVPAFWEDRLFSAEGTPVPFTIGDVVLEGGGVNPLPAVRRSHPVSKIRGRRPPISRKFSYKREPLPCQSGPIRAASITSTD